jgi:hypothetical protein
MTNRLMEASSLIMTPFDALSLDLTVERSKSCANPAGSSPVAQLSGIQRRFFERMGGRIDYPVDSLSLFYRPPIKCSNQAGISIRKTIKSRDAMSMAA